MWLRFPFVALICCGGCRSHAGLDEAELAAVVATMRPSIQFCFQTALDRQPHEDEVKMDAIIHVRSSGEVYQVEVGEGGLPGMKPCIEQAIIKWRFPPVAGETHTRLPLVFRPEKF